MNEQQREVKKYECSEFGINVEEAFSFTKHGPEIWSSWCVLHATLVIWRGKELHNEDLEISNNWVVDTFVEIIICREEKAGPFY